MIIKGGIEVDELRTQLRRVLSFINAARALPTPINATETEAMLVTVEAARVALVELMVRVKDAYARGLPAESAEAAELEALVGDVGRAGDRLLEASSLALDAARRHTSS